MTISYNWLCEYLPTTQEGNASGIERPDPEKMGKILTAIGLEVESLEKYESLKGGLEGLVIGEVMECIPHPDADKLKLTQVNIGTGSPLQIVCGAANVAVGQKVIVATIGTTLYPTSGEPIIIKKAKIRGMESQGMLCAEDEIGLGNGHDGILVLPNDSTPGSTAAAFFQPYEDHIFEIGLTPNRMDAMSHLGVARDVCAYLTHHTKKEHNVRSPFKNNFKPVLSGVPMKVLVENAQDCPRYSGVSLIGVTVGDSPQWLKQRLMSIGLRPINNIVDVTNFILHETGQPLHAFDANAIKGNKLIVKNLPEGTPFTSLDEKERKLSANDLMICNAVAPMCIAGVYGGMHSGVTVTTKNIFLESAWFDPKTIRKTALYHGLRTDAATRFEKGVDISNTVNVLKRAAALIKEVAGGEICSEIIDEYPAPREKTTVSLKYHYLKKLSGKNYHGDTIKNILNSLGFELVKEGRDEMWVNVPFFKPDITLPADLVEEIMRIDGLDNVEIPALITIAPAVETLEHENTYKEKVANYLVGLGFNEIFTNSITNSAYYNSTQLSASVKMINNLSVALDILRPTMLETGLESLAHNLNRRNTDLKFFEFGTTYTSDGIGNYKEQEHLCLYVTGNKNDTGWRTAADPVDFYYLKGIMENILTAMGLAVNNYLPKDNEKLTESVNAEVQKENVAELGAVNRKVLERFEIKQPLFYADLDWEQLLKMNKDNRITYRSIPKYPAVQRDLAIVVDKTLDFERVRKATDQAGIKKLTNIKLFDIFENDKLGVGKKSLAINFTFLDEEKTLTDQEIETMMDRIIKGYEKEFGATIRK